MRSHITTSSRAKLGLSLLIALAIGMLPAASASASTALPRFSGTFPDTYTLTSSQVTLESTGGGIIVCGGSEAKGSITGAKTGTLSSLKFTNCGSSCISVTTTELETIPVYTNKAEKKVALLLKPKTGTTLAIAKCFGESREIRGSILATISPKNEMVTRYTLESKGGRGKQNLTEYENEAGEKVHTTLESNIFFGEFLGLSMSFSQTLTMAHAITLEG